jgi:NAD(P)-dependent dehydrogenase (short-subunit alcohol dehydrogenase family)
MDLGITGKVALITGGNRGIGKASAVELAKEGCHIAITGRNEADLAATQKELQRHGVKALAVAADMETAAGVDKAVHETYAAFGHIDILFNNAGHSKPCTPISSTDQDWVSQLNIHLMACVRTCRLIVPKMIEQKWGRIINMSSMYGISPGSGVTDYNAAKAAVIQLTRSLACEWAPHAITVNSISPGYTETEMTRHATQWHADWRRDTPMGRMATPEEIRGAVVFLASPAASFITGHDLVIDGGFTCW